DRFLRMNLLGLPVRSSDQKIIARSKLPSLNLCYQVNINSLIQVWIKMLFYSARKSGGWEVLRLAVRCGGGCCAFLYFHDYKKAQIRFYGNPENGGSVQAG